MLRLSVKHQCIPLIIPPPFYMSKLKGAEDRGMKTWLRYFRPGVKTGLEDNRENSSAALGSTRKTHQGQWQGQGAKMSYVGYLIISLCQYVTQTCIICPLMSLHVLLSADTFAVSSVNKHERSQEDKSRAQVTQVVHSPGHHSCW